MGENGSLAHLSKPFHKGVTRLALLLYSPLKKAHPVVHHGCIPASWALIFFISCSSFVIY